MKRRKFLGVAAGTVVAVGGAGYLFSDRHNFVRDTDPIRNTGHTSNPDRLKNTNRNKVSGAPSPDPIEREILYLASLAPSGHNTQPWFVKYIEPYHWIVGNDKSKWLPAVDPTQRETVLSIGAFLQNLEYAANNAGYSYRYDLLATTNQDENVMDIRLAKSGSAPIFDIDKIMNRRTVRSNYLNDLLKKEDVDYFFDDEKEFFHYIPNVAKEYRYLNEQTIEANNIQSNRDAAEKELSEWIRFSSKDAAKYRDGLTTATMEIEGIPGWIVRNFYNKASVMKRDFRDKNMDIVTQQVSQSAGWLLITSKDSSVASLLETGKRMQRLFLKVREKGIAMHPMTQILEEPSTNKMVNRSVGIPDSIQFILRMGYVKNYPKPVSLRRPVDWFLRS